MKRLGLFFIFALVACNCDPEPTPCATRSDCPVPFVCQNSICIDPSDPPDASADGTPDLGSDGGVLCSDGRETCDGTCCPGRSVCFENQCGNDCGGAPICNRTCCGNGTECFQDRCVPQCDPASRCGEQGELCCDASEACLDNACTALGNECEFLEDCADNEICDPAFRRCIPKSDVACEFRPPVGVFSPSLGCRWEPSATDPFPAYRQVVMTPTVMNMTDDNGDGVTDQNDIPDIVFVSNDYDSHNCCSFKGVIRIVSGECNDDGTMNTLGTIANVFADVSGGIALGNIDPAGDAAAKAPEIVAFLGGGHIRNRPDIPDEDRPAVGIAVFRRTADDGSAWEEVWRNVTDFDGHGFTAVQPAIADLNGDGSPEVFAGNLVLNGQTGEKIWDGFETVRPGAGMGYNAFLGPVSTAADLDLDGKLEVIAGNTVYNGETGAEIWTYEYTTENSRCSGSFPCDGYNAVGNFDADPEGEVVSVRRGEIFVFEHDGVLKHKVEIPYLDCTHGATGQKANESGPPTIADFDGDGRPEIGTASADYYTVIDFDCTGNPLPAECDSENVRWKVRNRDCSSRATGSSVFDFEGDGRAEVVYADERNFRIFNGENGEVLFDDDTHSSNTRMEMPIVVDVDNDGKSEVIVPEPNRTDGLGGIEVWEDADNNWVRTRRVWNQHTYHVTNITEDGQVPAVEATNWSNPRLNNFRQNVQPGSLFDAPDLIVSSLEVVDCGGAGTLTFDVTIKNQGAAGVGRGIPIVVNIQATGMDTIQILSETSRPLLPGQSERIRVIWNPPGGSIPFDSFTVEARIDDDGMGGSEYNECKEDNNSFMTDAVSTCTIG